MVTTRRRSASANEDSASLAVGRRERRKQETSEKLFAAAMELFSSKGFSQTKVEDITERADVGKGTFFNYFPSKEHVLGYLVSRQMGTVQRHLQLAREGEMQTTDILVSLGRDLIRVPGKSPQMARSIVLAFLGNVEVRQYMVREISVGRGLIAEILRLGQERGELREELSAAQLARVFQHSLFGTLVLWSLDPEAPLAKQFQATMQIFLSGLSASTSAKPKRKREEKL